MDHSHNYNTQQQHAFYLLKDLMETILQCETGIGTSFHIQKAVRLRNELVQLLQNDASIDHPFLQQIWDECFFRASEQHEMEHHHKANKTEISWQLVFDHDYSE